MLQRKGDKGGEKKDNYYSQGQGNKYDRDVDGHSMDRNMNQVEKSSQSWSSHFRSALLKHQ